MAKKRPKTSTSISPLNASMDVGDGEDAADDNHKRSNAQPKSKRSRGDGSKYTNNSKPRKKKMSASKLSEEAALTSMLFGASSGGAAWMDDDNDDNNNGEDDIVSGWNDRDALVESNKQQLDDNEDEEDGEEAGAGTSGDLFAIDRAGEEVTDDVLDEEDAEDNASQDGQHSSDGNLEASDDDADSDEESGDDEDGEADNKAAMTGAAWKDSDSEHSSSEDSESESEDEDLEPEEEDESSTSDNSAEPSKSRKPKKEKNNGGGVSLVDGPNRLKKLRRYRDETDPISIKEYELRLRERFMNTASVAARTDWADVGAAQKAQEEDHAGAEPSKKQKKKGGGYASSTEEESSDDEEEYGAAKTILESNATLFETSTNGLPLPPTLLNIARSRDGNLTDPSNSVVSSVQFHPGSDEDNPLLMTAGMDKMLRFFRIDGEDNAKIHGIQFPKLPITCASFLGSDGGSVVLSGRRPFFYVYDAVSGNIQKIPSIVGRKERSLEKFKVSPDGRYIAFMGNDGYVILVDGKTRQWIGDLKMNGSVRAVTFSEDGEYVLGSGSDGDVYRWHVGSRRCVERFHNEDGTITSALAMSSNNFLAVGAESGVVNLYNDKQSSSFLARRGGLSLKATERNSIKSIMNMTTSADNVCFNHDGQILAMSTRRETNGLKLLHVPTATVFSNWPTSKTPLKYVWSMDFSPGSKYMAVGNDHGKCLLYRLKHYWDE